MSLHTKTLGKYQIVERLGRGGMAEVYKAYQPNLARHVAIKVIRAAIAEEPEIVERFEREAKSAASLHHPHIVQMYDYDVDPESGEPYMVMELIEGGSLAEYLRKQQGLLPLGAVAQIMSEVGGALAYAHRQQIVHRDVKPANVMRDALGRCILTDFGLAKILAEAGQSGSASTLGTPDYMAPEQVQGAPADQRADIYALGVMLFQMLTGQLPYTADTPTALMLKHLTEPVPNPRTANPHLPDSLAEVIERSLAKVPDNRFQTVEDLLQQLHSTLQSIDAALTVAPIAEQATPTRPAAAKVTSPASKLVVSSAPTLPPTLPTPPEPTLPPTIAHFVGRVSELEHYTAELRARHLAIVVGMPGVGKSALGAALVRSLNRPSDSFWHTFKPGEGVNVLLWKLAGFLAWHSQPDLWQTLQSGTQPGHTLPPIEVLFDYMFHMLKGSGYVLALDDFQYIDADPLISEFLQRLRPALAAGDADVVLVSQRRPDWAAEEESPPLGGLSPDDMHALLALRNIYLPPESLTELHALTGGNAQLLTLALDWLKRAQDPARQVHRLTENEHIERFLIKQIDEDLTEAERQVMMAVAILLGYPGTRDVLTAVLDGASVRRPLNALTTRSLLQVQDEDGARAYSYPALVREYYYDLIGQRERQTMHQRAAEFYEAIPEPLRSALHFQRAGQTSRAAQLITPNVWTILNQGQGRNLRAALEQFTAQQLAPSEWAEVLLARGQTHTFFGDLAPARASYEAVLALSARTEMAARACLGLGELLQRHAPREAQAFLAQGLAAGQHTHPPIGAPTEAALLIRQGIVTDILGDSDTATTLLKAGLAVLGDAPDSLRATALSNLGIIHCARGDLLAGLPYFQHALALYEQSHDRWGMIGAWHNLAVALDTLGRWTEAAAYYAQRIEAAEALGSAAKQFAGLLGLGILQYKQGDLYTAEHNLTRALDNARRRGARGDLIYVLPVLAGVYIDSNRLDEAEPLLQETEDHIHATEDRYPLAEAYRHWTRLRLAQNRSAEAHDFIQRSVTVARELHLPIEEGQSLRVLAQLQLAADQREAALVTFEESHALLAGRDPYEAARVQLAWGHALHPTNPARAAALRAEAHTTLQRLEVRTSGWDTL